MVTCSNAPVEAALGGVAPVPAHKADRRLTALRASPNITAGCGHRRPALERPGPGSNAAAQIATLLVAHLLKNATQRNS